MVDFNDLSPHQQRLQAILNERFPRDARTIKDQPVGIDVWARIVWERDGEMWMMGSATRWTRTHVFVEFGDRRLATRGVWVKPGDVRRR
jgi:hypothetical protein